jgi:DNA (cytosine-5)-methyltransferase 1
MFTLQAGAQHGVAAFHENQRAEITMNDTAGSLKVGGGKPGQGYPAVMTNMAVRRLTPVECERLQGFPDGYTNIPWRNKPEAPDGPRYKALGNSMAVPVMAWIGRRIAERLQ